MENGYIHCIICGKPLYIQDEQWVVKPEGYICGMCKRSFESNYLLHRLNCFKTGIDKPEFTFLESRLNCSTYDDGEPFENMTFIC